MLRFHPAAHRPRSVLVCLYLLICLAMPVSAADDYRDWFAFEPENSPEQGVIGMADWLEKPAGGRGFVQIDGDRFVFEDGTPVIFWGVNNGSQGCAPSRREADERVAYYAKHGVNAVRLHKFTNPLRHERDGTRLDPDAQRRLDYYFEQLREAGIYYGWSHIFRHNLKPGDRDRVLAYDEIVNANRNWTTGLVNFAPDLQDLHIELTVNMLEHRNPHTGLRYAEDPALAFIELQNEDNIFFGTTLAGMQNCPTYMDLACELFSDWLKEKYGSHEALAEAWDGAFDVEPDMRSGEHLDKRNILPICHPWWYSAAGLEAKHYHQRLYDTARWMYETQNAFYQRFIEAIRQTGYKGPIVGSCWQAGEGFTHYYNLHADYLAGIIDRHNYSGGGEHRLSTRASIDNTPMLAQPGGGILSTGLQQVEGRPFALSEWIVKPPVEWTAEGPAIIATYGMGLQGWDASYHFASKGAYGARGENDFPKEGNDNSPLELANPHVYNVDLPSQIGQYPAIARMLYRGDLEPGAPLPTRNVHVPSLAEGRVGFSESVEQSGDFKAFSGLTPPEALAVGRVRVAFTEAFEPSEAPDLSDFQEPGLIRSSTGQLLWRYGGGRGHITVDTPGTKAVIGFAEGEVYDLGGVKIRLRSPFAVLWITALERDLTANRRFLLTVMGRHVNTGMAYNDEKTRLTRVGGPPLLMEPIEADIGMPRPLAEVNVLDADGRRTGETVPITASGEGSAFSIDGRRDKTIYYELVLR
jgi:hypothetical protein